MNRFDEMPKEAEERLLRIGKRLQTKSLPFVRWNRDTFEINERSVLHSQWIALADQATAGWKRWNPNFTKVEEKTATVCIYEQDELPRPKMSVGDQKDMWRPEFELPLQQIETGELALFTCSYEWARRAIGAVIEYFARTRRRPIVQLEARETIRDGKPVIVGALVIVAPDEGDGFVIDLTRDSVPAATGSSADAPGPKHDDMDDDIPY
jgi:hypothetical protein